MTAGATPQYSLAMSEEERNILVDVLEQLLKETRVEEHRTEAFRAKEVVHARVAAIESLCNKARAARAG
ncbi:MAG: hypothetical protein ACJ8FY_08420 [Gemmataceae bacterium]